MKIITEMHRAPYIIYLRSGRVTKVFKGDKCDMYKKFNKIKTIVSVRENRRQHAWTIKRRQVLAMGKFSIDPIFQSGSHQDLLDRVLLLTRKLLNQRFLSVKLKSSLRKFYGRHNDLVSRYGTSVSQMTSDMFHLLSTLPRPFVIPDLSRLCN